MKLDSEKIVHPEHPRARKYCTTGPEFVKHCRGRSEGTSIYKKKALRSGLVPAGRELMKI
jgi:hypothetical protein